MHIGLIVGIGPAATDYYYRTILQAMMDGGRDLELTMVHADTSTLLENQAAGDVNGQVGIYEKLTRRLQLAGAEAVAVTSIAGHFCIGEFKQISPLPVIDLCDVVRKELHERGFRRVGLLGTKTVMESGFYGALGDVVVIAPGSEWIEDVHTNYVSMTKSGVCSQQQRQVFFNAGQRMVADGNIDAVLLAGTDLTLAFNGENPGFRVFDCAHVHALKIAELAQIVRPSHHHEVEICGSKGDFSSTEAY